MRLVWLGICAALAAIPAPTKAGTFLEEHPLIGAWQSTDDAYYVTEWDETIYLIRSTDGHVWTLTPRQANAAAFDLADLDDAPIGATLRVEGDHRRVESGNAPVGAAARVRFPARDFVARNGNEAELHGTVLLPEHDDPQAVIVYLNGEGPNPRTDVLPTALALLREGYAAVVFDQRHAGASTGTENAGSYYERSQRAAADAAAVTRMVTNDPRFQGIPVGVAGWSQGGWIGAIVARGNPEVDFYINVAGNAALPWQQWRHSMRCRLIRAGVKPSGIVNADAYFDAFYGTMMGSTAWDDYAAALQTARTQAWWEVMKRRNFAEWDNLEEALEFGRGDQVRDPADDFRLVTIPTLGLFFEFDGSSPPAYLQRTPIEIDSSGRVCIGYVNQLPQRNVRLATKVGSSWTEQPISDGEHVSLDLDASDQLHICFSNDQNQLEYRVPATGTTEIVDEVRIVGETAMVVTVTGTVHIAYESSEELRYAQRTPDGWSLESVAPAGAFPSMDVGPSSVHVAYVEDGTLHHAWRTQPVASARTPVSRMKSRFGSDQ